VVIAAVAASYLIGAIPFGVLLTRAFSGADVRAAGSGNIGATNVLRVAGKRLGVATLVLDVLKGLLPVLAATWRLESPEAHAAVGVAALLGHCFPVYLKFQGGKGVATGVGAVIGLAPYAAVLALAVFIVVVGVTRWVSLGSMTASASIPILLFIRDGVSAAMLATLFMAALVIARHHANIGRLARGEEPKLGQTA